MCIFALAYILDNCVFRESIDSPVVRSGNLLDSQTKQFSRRAGSSGISESQQAPQSSGPFGRNMGGSMLWNTLDSEIQPATAGFATSRVKRLTNSALAALIGLSAPMALAQSYVPAIVPTASTTLYTSAAVISPGRVAVDKAGNVYLIAVVGSSSTLMEIPAATQTGTNAAPVT